MGPAPFAHTMDAIGAIVRIARRRIMMRDTVSCVGTASVVAGVAMLALLVGARLASAWVPWLGSPIVLWIVMGLAIVAVMVWTFVRVARPSDLAVSSIVDVRLGLHDRLSTAIAVASRTDPFARAAIEDGMRAAQDRRVREGVAAACPIDMSPRSLGGLGLMALAVVAWMLLPPIPVGASDSRSPADTGEIAAARAAAAEDGTVGPGREQLEHAHPSLIVARRDRIVPAPLAAESPAPRPTTVASLPRRTAAMIAPPA